MEFLGCLEVKPQYSLNFLTRLLASVSSLYNKAEIMAFSQLSIGCWHWLIWDDCGCNFGITTERKSGMVLVRSTFSFAFLEVGGSVFWNPVEFLHGSAYYAEINSSKSPSCLV